MSQTTTTAQLQAGPRVDDKSTFHNISHVRSMNDERQVELTPHHTYEWIKFVDPTDSQKDFADHEVVDQYGIPTHMVTGYLASEISEEASFKNLPFAVLLVFVFALLYIKKDEAKIVRNVEEGITFDIEENANFAFSKPGFMGHKNVYDVNSYADFWSWLSLGFVAITMPTETPVSEGQNLYWIRGEWRKRIKSNPIVGEDKLFYMQYNKIIGGIRLRQEVAPKSECPDQPLADVMYPKTCHPTIGITPLNINLEPELYDVEVTVSNYDPAPQNNVWFLIGNETGEEKLKRLRRLEIDGWLNEKTVHIAVDFMTYNGHFQTLTWTAVHFFFTRSGHIWKAIVHESIFLDPYTKGGLTLFILDGLFLLHLTYILVVELKEIFNDCNALCAKGPINFLKEYINFWNAVDWASILMGYAIFIIWLHIVGESGTAKENMLALEKDTDNPELIPQLVDFIKHFDGLARVVHKYRYIAAGYPVMIVLRLFKAFAAQPRLAVVTQTISTAFVDIVHFGIVFTSIFLNYAVMGVALFGRETSDFCTMSRATGSLFLVLMGDFELEELRQIGRLLCGIWFWTFMVLVLLIMLNMLIAIIMDTYTDVKQKISGSDTLWFQAYDMYRRYRGRKAGTRLSIHQVYDQLVLIDQEAILDVQTFMNAVPGIEFKQAHRLMVGAVKFFRESTEEAMSLADAMGVISSVHSEMVIIMEDHSPQKSNKHKDLRLLHAGSELIARAHSIHQHVDQELLKQHPGQHPAMPGQHPGQNPAMSMRGNAIGPNAGHPMPPAGMGQAASSSAMPKAHGGNAFIEATNGFHMGAQHPGVGMHNPGMGGVGVSNSQHGPGNPWAGQNGSMNAANGLAQAAQRGRGYGSAENATVLGGARMMREEMAAHHDAVMGSNGYIDPAQQLTEMYTTDVLIEAARLRAMQSLGAADDGSRMLSATLSVLSNLVLEPELCCDTLRRASRKWDMIPGVGYDPGRPRADMPVSTSTAFCPCVTEPPPASMPERQRYASQPL